MELISSKPENKLHKTETKTFFSVLFALSLTHFLNDTIQSLIPAIYPIVKQSYHLSYTEVGFISFTFQITSSILQPVVGFHTDKKPKPFLLTIGMVVSLIGLIFLSFAYNLGWLIISAGLVGIGSAIFHPESSYIAHLASGGRKGMAQSIFQVGGNFGLSMGPLLAALIIVPLGQVSILWFSLLALVAIIILFRIGKWHKGNAKHKISIIKKSIPHLHSGLSKKRVAISIFILLTLVFSKYFYLASMTSYLTFYLIEKFHVSIQIAQLHLFIFLLSVAVGTIIGGPIGDKIGRKYVIWGSILGVAPFTLLLPHVSLFATTILTIFIGVILASAFSAILVYAQELVPGRVALISGLFFGFAFGMGGIGNALLGHLADVTGIIHVYKVCSFLPLIGLLAAFLPEIKQNTNIRRS